MSQELEVAVLLIEDNPQHAKLITRLLADSPVRVTHAATIAAATEQLHHAAPQALLLDLSLPDSTKPMETIRWALEAAPNRPVLVLTSMTDLEFAVEAVKAGAQDYIVKGEMDGGSLVRSIKYAIERQNMILELERSNNELLHFSYVVAHELRSPLTLMLAATNQLKTKYAAHLPKEIMEWIEDNEHGTQRINQFVSELLAFSRVQQQTDIEPVTLAKLTAAAKSTLTSEIAESNARVSVEDDCVLLCNPVIIEHVIRNLVANAIKYRRGDAEPDITIRGNDRDQHWEISVADNGVGIDPNEFQRIFMLFARAHETAVKPGVGIGLAFCKQAIEKLGGRMWVKSVPQQGSDFYFTIPKPDLEEE